MTRFQVAGRSSDGLKMKNPAALAVQRSTTLVDGI
jgi:hypothetical protein